MASQSTPELGGNSMASLLAGDITAVDAKQVHTPAPHLVGVLFSVSTHCSRPPSLQKA